jgi:hypothetical protein
MCEIVTTLVIISLKQFMLISLINTLGQTKNKMNSETIHKVFIGSLPVYTSSVQFQILSLCNWCVFRVRETKHNYHEIVKVWNPCETREQVLTSTRHTRAS